MTTEERSPLRLGRVRRRLGRIFLWSFEAQDHQNKNVRCPRSPTHTAVTLSLKEFAMSARLLLLLAGFLAFVPSSAQALELKNFRMAHGPLGAAHRHEVPSGRLSLYHIRDRGAQSRRQEQGQLRDSCRGFRRRQQDDLLKGNPQRPHSAIGGRRFRAISTSPWGPTDPPGQYRVRLTVKDVIGKDIKSSTHPFELLAKDFGIVGVMAPAVAFPGQPYMLQYNVVELGLDATKKPNAKIELKVLDDTGKAVSTPAVSNYPADLPENLDLMKSNFIPIDFPIFPNRAGRFRVEITVVDNLKKKNASLSYPLNVLDIGAIASGK